MSGLRPATEALVFDFGDGSVASGLGDLAGCSSGSAAGFGFSGGRVGVESLTQIVVAEPDDGVASGQDGFAQGQVGSGDGVEAGGSSSAAVGRSAQVVECSNGFAVIGGRREGLQLAFRWRRGQPGGSGPGWPPRCAWGIGWRERYVAADRLGAEAMSSSGLQGAVRRLADVRRRRGGGGGASKSQPRPTIAGQPIYLGERKPAIPTCRDEVVAAIEALVAGGGAPVFTVENVHGATVSCGSAWSRETVAKTMLRMTRPARRPPYLELERAESDLYRVVPFREGLGRS